jgi:hypothetical protein
MLVLGSSIPDQSGWHPSLYLLRSDRLWLPYWDGRARWRWRWRFTIDLSDSRNLIPLIEYIGLCFPIPIEIVAPLTHQILTGF